MQTADIIRIRNNILLVHGKQDSKMHEIDIEFSAYGVQFLCVSPRVTFCRVHLVFARLLNDCDVGM